MGERDFLLDILDPKVPLGEVEKAVPASTVFRQFVDSINIFADKKNWLYFYSLFMTSLLAVPAYFFWFEYYTHGLFGFSAFIYFFPCNLFSTIYYHRYCSHKAFKVQSSFGRFIIKNLMPRIFMEEVFALCHVVHHKYSDGPNDPHNPKGGSAFSFFADFTQMRTNPNLDEKNYKRLKAMFSHIPMKLNSFSEYQKWGSLSNPIDTVRHHVLSWMFWGVLIYLTLGVEYVCAFGNACFIWELLVRRFNYKSHGGGEDKKNENDPDRGSLSLNQKVPGFLCGEWHNNHHYYPTSANCALEPWQVDFTFVLIKGLSKVGIIDSYIDKSKAFEGNSIVKAEVIRE